MSNLRPEGDKGELGLVGSCYTGGGTNPLDCLFHISPLERVDETRVRFRVTTEKDLV